MKTELGLKLRMAMANRCGATLGAPPASLFGVLVPHSKDGVMNVLGGHFWGAANGVSTCACVHGRRCV